MTPTRQTIIDACNMTQARANATNDHMLQALACSMVIMNRVNYYELDSDVWPKELYLIRCSDDGRLFWFEEHNG